MAHGFTAVDEQARPEEWVGVLDRLTGEPFYAGYKARLPELLRPQPGRRYLDVGAGTGEAAARLAAGNGVRVAAADRSTTMARQCRARGLDWVVTADAHRLPFADASFDGAWADRVLQHLAEPGGALDEMVRVVRPGGRLVLADPDYDTQVLDIEDQALARAVLRFRADAALRNGTLAHRHAGLLASRGLVDVAVEARVLVVRDPTAVDNVMGLRSWAATAAERGHLSAADAVRFVEQFDRAVAQGRFTYAVTFFLTCGTVEPGSAGSGPAGSGHPATTWEH